ncbi:DUF58 domain-containing protein [Nocardiopsis sp. NRRL B-16309]|uniref:DUF58 domain-containing protein n=1 Tax=Nocardiopsis sp. NRRL B-16309 TaxID=1519494 RepID=UPI0006AEA791|nr:DUF58 domain-containing protein [Nocardiopsis sp. NRRL B-16309]KOX07331.1 hypothetical protein ADL05_28915 [Nocardiopsis sp. NRRL B-16309]
MLVLGLVAVVAGSVLGQRELVAVGVLLLAVPPLSALTVVGATARIAHSRSVVPVRVAAGHDARVLVRVGNTSRTWPVSALFVEDTLPAPLGTEPRYTIGHLGPRAVRDVTYLVRPAVRGSYPVGPLRIGVADPLGCVRVTRDVGAPSTLLVTPPVVPLDALGGADGSQGEQSPRRTVSGVGEQDPVPREYRHGDELRRVHWRSTAKQGELMVRRDEQHWRENSSILLDTRRSAHRGEGPGGSLETAVSAAASVAVHLIDGGHELRFLTERGRMHTADASGVLDGLAVTRASDAPGLFGGIDQLGGSRSASSSLLVAVLGAVSAEEAAALSAVRGAAARVAVLCAHGAWPAHPSAPEAAPAPGLPESVRGVRDVLTSGGWRVLIVSSASELPALWRRATAGEGAAAPYPSREGRR